MLDINENLMRMDFGSRRFSSVIERMTLAAETLLDSKKGYLTERDKILVESVIHAICAEMLLMGLIEPDTRHSEKDKGR